MMTIKINDDGAMIDSFLWKLQNLEKNLRITILVQHNQHKPALTYLFIFTTSIHNAKFSVWFIPFPN